MDNLIKFAVTITNDPVIGKKKVTGMPKKWNNITSSKYHGEDNFAVLTGKINNIIIVDLDRKDPEFIGLEWFEKNFGKISEINTLITKTINNGYHVFFKYTSDIKNTNNNDLHIDILSDLRCCYQGVGYDIINESDIRELTPIEVSFIQTLSLSKNNTSQNEFLELNKLLSISLNTQWREEKSGDNIKAIPDTLNCLVDVSKIHSSREHSALFINTNNTVVKKCFSCGSDILSKIDRDLVIAFFKKNEAGTEWEPETLLKSTDNIINDHFIEKYSNGNIVDIKYKKNNIIGKIMNNKDLRVEHFVHNEECRGDLFYNINIDRDIENKISTKINCKKCGYNHDEQHCDNTIVYQLIYNNINENRNELSIIINTDKQLKIVENEYINQLLYLSLTQEDGYITDILYEMFKNTYILIENTWYRFNGIIWCKIKEIYPREILLAVNNIREYILEIYKKHYRVKNLENELDTLHKITSNLSKKLNKSNEDISYVSASKKFFSRPGLLFNEDSNLIAFQNGVYDLKAMTFRRGSPQDYLSIQMDYHFIEETNTRQRDYLLQFLEDILPNRDVREFLLYNIASCLLNMPNREQEFYILTGKKGANGKSVLSNLIEDTFDEFYAAPEPTLLTKPREKANETNEALKDLIGKRIAIISEPDKRDRIIASNLKKFTGCDTITVRGNHEQSQKMNIKMKFFMLCNSIPLLDDCKDAEIRRLCVINFPTRFCENPTRANEKKIDITVSEQLKLCKSEFFKLLLSYLVEYKNISGLGNKIIKPNEVTKQLDNYIQRNKSDIDDFIETHLEYSIGTRIHCKEIYELFEEWCIEEHKEKIKNKDLDDLIEYIFDIDIKKKFRKDGIRNFGWENLSLKNNET
jgi:P4 family phage/plasmid primase-like protien